MRLAQPRDAARIASLHVEVWQTAYKGIINDNYLKELAVADREVGWKQRLAEESIVTFLAEEGGCVVGFIAGGKSRDEDDQNTTAEIYAIYINRSFSRKGIGAALLRQALERLGQMGFTDIVLWVLQKNIAARSFYEKNRMQPQGGKTRKIMIGGEAHTEIMYSTKVRRDRSGS